MTSNQTIVIAKPRSKRTAKGAYFSGAQGEYPRNDSRGMTHGGCSCSHYPPRPDLAKDADIKEWLALAEPEEFPVENKTRRGGSSLRPTVFSTESPDFAYRPAGRTSVAVQPDEYDEYDEAGRRIYRVAENCDAWSLVCRRG